MGGVTALHRAVRNRCSMAVATMLALGADPQRPNDNGSTPLALANWTKGAVAQEALRRKSSLRKFCDC